MRIRILSLFCLLLALWPAAHIQAADFHSGDEVIISSRVAGNLYIAAGKVTVNAVVEGDIVVGGGSVYIRDSVLQDVLVTGGEVDIAGYVGDDVRVAGGQVTVLNQVGGDVLAFSGRVKLGKNVTIYGDMGLFAGKIEVVATVRGNAMIRGGNIDISGSVLGNLDARGGSLTMTGMVAGDALLAADELEVLEPAQFAGALHYWSDDGELDLAAFMISENPIFDPDLEVDMDFDWRYLGIGMVLFWVLSLLSSIILILLLVLLFPRWVKSVGVDTRTNWWKHGLYGLAYFIGTPIAIGILLVTIIGIPFALILMLLYGLTLLYGTTLGSIGIASFLTSQITTAWNRLLVIVFAIAIVITVKVIGLIPLFGWLLIMVVMLYGVGSMISNIAAKRAGRQPRSTEQGH